MGYNIRPKNTDVNNKMAWIAYNCKHMAKAKKYLKAALVTGSKNPELLQKSIAINSKKNLIIKSEGLQVKNILLYALLLSYAIVICKPALPYVSDLIGHLVFSKNHMATVHFENGKYHLHKEIVKNALDNEAQKAPLTSKKDNKANEHIISILRLSAFVKVVNAHNYPLTPIPLLSLGKYLHPFLPPQC